MDYNLKHLQELEAESIYVLREVAAQFQNPVLLFSGGKDSIVMSYLAKKAFAPGKIPFPMMHVDTGHNFQEALDFRDARAEKIGARMIVKLVQDSIDSGRAVEEKWANASRNGLQIVTLLDGLEEEKFDAAMWWGRRDEEKARAKERFFSHRDEFGQRDPKNQRPELWNLFNGKRNMGEHFRVFPISNWTEMDIRQYILQEEIEIPSLYLSHTRDCYVRDGITLAYDERFITLKEWEEIQPTVVRYRTLGDITCTWAVHSDADTIEKIIEEVAATRITERWGRSDDKRSETAMEDRKKQGYF